MTADKSIQELCDIRNSTRRAILSILNGTNWPPESREAADNLLQTINDLPDVPPDANMTPFKDTLEDFVRVLEESGTRVEEVSEKYGRGEGGCLGGIKYRLSSRRPRRCTEALLACSVEIGNAWKKLRDRLIDTSMGGPVQASETPFEIQLQSATPLVEVDPPPKTKPAEKTIPSGQPTGQPASLQASSPSPLEGEKNRSSIRDVGLSAARTTFQVVEAGSGAIPVVGGFVGVAAKVGLTFVNMIETMGENEDVSKELTSHTSKLSSYLEYFKKKVNADQSDEVAEHIEDLRRELECVKDKVKEWNSLGRFNKAFSASDHADELKAHQGTLETTLEEMQLLVSLKTTDLVVELSICFGLLCKWGFSDFFLVDLDDTVLRAERTRLLDRLGDGSYGARGDTIDEVICLPGTRLEILNRIDQWIRDTPNPESRVLWIRGMAGRGKSTIASTVAHNWGSKGSCAIFHFRRGQHTQEDRFVCALARQLGKALVPEVREAILDCVKEKEDIAKERVDQQFKTLFVGALGGTQDQTHPIVIVVDALDECKDVNHAVRFVKLIGQHSKSLPPNVKFLLTCRPEPPLVLALELQKWRGEDLDTVPDVSGDIRRFVRYACAQIRDQHGLPRAWPLATDLEAMVEMSQGLFQWARTAIAYISDRSPGNRLQELLQHPSKWGGLDELYHQILLKAFNEVEKKPVRKQLLSWVLGTLVVAPHPVTLEVIAFLHADCEIVAGQATTVQVLRDDILADLNSLLHIPKSDSEPVRLMHTSIRDLLVTRERCEDGRYSVDPRQDHQRLATLSLQVMQRDLKQNICNVAHIPMANADIQDAVDRHIPAGLRYCCRSWSTHIMAGFSSSEVTEPAVHIVMNRFKLFSDEKILGWLEVLSLIGAMAEAYSVAEQVRQWLLDWSPRRPDDSLSVMWNDTYRLIRAFFNEMSFNAFDIYAAALPQSPVETELWRKYHGQATAWRLVGKRERNWSANIWTVSGKGAVTGVAFSPNGDILASASNERWGPYVVQLWDRQTGAPLSDPLTGHSDSIWSVVFSPDGKVLASGSGDETVRLWDAQTGAPLGDPLTGHSHSIRSVVFSPDGKVLASGSDDETVRLWDAQTGAPLGDPPPLVATKFQI